MEHWGKQYDFRQNGFVNFDLNAIEEIVAIDDDEGIRNLLGSVNRISELDILAFENSRSGVKRLEEKLKENVNEPSRILVLSDMNLTPGHLGDEYSFFSQYPVNLYEQCAQKKFPFAFMSGSYSEFDQKVISYNQIGRNVPVIPKTSVMRLIMSLPNFKHKSIHKTKENA